MKNDMVRRGLSNFIFDKKKYEAVFLTLAFIVFFLLGVKFLNYLYWQEDDWSRVLWHNFYKQSENIDNVYLGSSHAFCAINPEILDEKNEKNNFNMATSGQRLIESYYVLKEINRHHKIENVYLELFYNPSTGVLGDYQNRISIQVGWRTMDHMRFSPLKAEALFLMNPKRYYGEAFFPFMRYREQLMNNDWIKLMSDYKGAENYKNYIYIDANKDIEYRDKGYFYTTSELANLSFGRDITPEEMYLTKDAENSLRKIIAYCQKRNISITLFSAPMYEIEPISVENYDNYANQIKKIADEYAVPYYDFNMTKEEYLPIQNPEYFFDIGHLNTKGAEIYTNFFYQVVSASPKENEKYFYDSYEEKLKNGKPRVYGLYFYGADVVELQEGDEPGETVRMAVASNRETELEYQIVLTPDGGETFLLQDFSTNKKFNVSMQEHGVCEIVWRSVEDKGKTESMEVRY